jgi:CheY-like chemotaxis protein
MKERPIDSPMRILLLEDDPADVELCMHALMRALTCDVVVAQSPEAFQNAIALQQPEVIVSDSGVLGMTGLEALKMAKAKFPNVPFILCSANDSPARIAQALQMGVDRFVSKDHQFQLLVQEIKRLGIAGTG